MTDLEKTAAENETKFETIELPDDVRAKLDSIGVNGSSVLQVQSDLDKDGRWGKRFLVATPTRVVGLSSPLSPNDTEATSSTRSAENPAETVKTKEPKTLPAPPDVASFIKHGQSRKRYLLGRARAQWKQLQSDGFLEELAKL